MVRRGIADAANDFQHIEPSWLSVAYCGEYEGSKKNPERDTIFENVWEMNALANADKETLRISIDTKATVNIGEYSRHGRSRGLEPVKAWDHDMRMKEKLIPGGILEPVSGRRFSFLPAAIKQVTSCLTDFFFGGTKESMNCPM